MNDKESSRFCDSICNETLSKFLHMKKGSKINFMNSENLILDKNKIILFRADKLKQRVRP